MNVLAETGLEMGLTDVTMVVNRMDTVRTLLPISHSRCLPIVPTVPSHVFAALASSHWRDCHFAGALSPSLLKHLLKVEGVAAE